MNKISNFHSFMNEGKYSSFILDITREYINEFKIFSNSKKKSFEFERFIELYETCPIKIITKNNSHVKYAFDTSASVTWDEYESWDVILIEVTINKEFFPMAFNDFIAEIKDCIRHELEHVAQNTNHNKGFLNKRQTKVGKRTSYADYILSSTELPAHLQGLLVNAKFKKISMNRMIKKFLEDRIDWFKNDMKDYDVVEKKLIETGKKMFPNAKWD